MWFNRQYQLWPVGYIGGGDRVRQTPDKHSLTSSFFYRSYKPATASGLQSRAEEDCGGAEGRDGKRVCF